MNEEKEKSEQPTTTNMTPEQIIAQKKKEIQELEKKVSEEKEVKKAEEKKARGERSNLLGKKNETLSSIQKKIYAYNKLGKKARAESKILEDINYEINLWMKKS